MKNKYWFISFIISFVIGLNIIIPILTGKNAIDYLMDVVSDTEKMVLEVGDEPFNNTTNENWWVYPELAPGQIYAAPELNWTKFWKVFKNHAMWSLEGYTDGQWEYYNDSLTINRDSVGDNSKKITLIFDAPCEVTTDYRLTFAIDYRVRDYVHNVDKYTYNISYEVNGESFNLSYDFSDIAAIPGIIINHGVNDDYFWFKARKNDVAPDTHVELDPTATVYTGTNVRCGNPSLRKLVRQSNGTIWCTFDENYDVHVAWSDDNGVTWNDKEVYGVAANRYSSIAVDSNDVVHLVYQTQVYGADYQLVYSNSSNWNVIVRIRSEAKHHTNPAIAIDSNDNIHIVYHKEEEGLSNNYQVGYINSTDNGGSWGTEQIITNEPDAADIASQSSIAIDSNDVIHVVFYCTNHYLGKADILHMESSDYGSTWTDWEGDPVYQNDTYDQYTPCIVIDDNDVPYVVWRGNNQYTTSQIGYSHNDSSGWSSAEWLTWDPTELHYYASIAVNDNDYIHATFGAYGTRLNHSVNDTISWTMNKVLTGNYITSNLISTQWPIIDSFKTNRPKTGYAFICAFGMSNIIYYASDDLTWDAPNVAPTQSNQNVWNATTHIEKSLNAIDVDLYPTSFNVTINDPEGVKMNITILTNESGLWTIVNQTTGTGLPDGTYNFTNASWVDTYNTKYWISFNVTDGSLWSNETYNFITSDVPLSNWNYYRTITINSSYICTSFTNFPLLVIIPPDIGAKCDDGDSIRFVSLDNVTRYNYEIELWNNTGDSFVWVNIPSLTNSSNKFLMYYNNSNVIDHQHVTDVWDDNYVLVCHMSDTPTGTIYDSTSYSNDLTSVGGMVDGDLVDGKIGKAIDFDGVDDYIYALDHASLKPASAVTLTNWIKASSGDIDEWTIGKMERDQWGNTDSCSYGIRYDTEGATNVEGAYAITNGNGINYVSAGVIWLNDSWCFGSTTFDAVNTKRIYVNDSLENSEDHGDILDYDLASSLYVMASKVGVGIGINDWQKGIVDEFRISNICRSSCWINTSFHSMNNTTGFFTWSDEIIIGPSAVYHNINVINGSIYNITIYNTILDYNGSIYNTTVYQTISTINGSIYNISTQHTINDINGSIYNTSDAVTITRIAYLPVNIRINDTSYINITFNITTGWTPINQSSILFVHTVNQTAAGFGYNFTYRMLRDSVELRSMNRNEDKWFEKFNSITGTGEIGYYGEWGAHDNTSIKFNVVDYGSNWTTVRFNNLTTLVPHLFSNIWYIDRTDVQDNSSSIFDVYANFAYKTKFNMTNTDFYTDPQYNGSLYQFYYNMNDTGSPNKPVKIYLANESYVSGKPATSDNCVLIGEHYDNDVADYLIRNSSYWGINFSTNSAGYVGTLKMTDLFYFIFVSRAGDITNKYDLAFCDTNTSGRDFNNSQFVEYSINGGTAWSTQNGTIDCHLKYAKLDDSSRIEYKVYANDTGGNEAWSTVYTDVIDIVNVPPNPTNILTQNGTITEYTKGDIINITYRWIGDPNQDVCWVNTTCLDSAHAIVAYIENRSITHAEVEINSTFYIDWDTTTVTPGNYYHINMTATDTYGLTTGSSSNGTFNLSAIWNTIETLNGSVYNSSVQNTIDDINGSVYNITAYNTVSTINGSIYNTTIYQTVETLNGSVYNITTYNNIVDINGSVYNETVVWNNIEIINGSIYNSSIQNIISDINGSVYNTTIKNTISDINGSVYNTSVLWSTINDWNGSIFNSSVNTSVDIIIPYIVGSFPINITVTGTGVIDNVTLWYRFSIDNVTWGANVSFDIDTTSPWTWDFNFTNNTGYYEFYSVGEGVGGIEPNPTVFDAMCYFNWGNFIGKGYTQLYETKSKVIPFIGFGMIMFFLFFKQKIHKKVKVKNNRVII